MNTILLEPTDVLFFRDGRPMGGASSGHGAAWPLPNVINHALHAALHRAGFAGVHEHRRGRSGDYQETRDRKFGSLVTAGPFPVCTKGQDRTWFFPRPADADDSGEAVLRPCNTTPGASSLAAPCLHPVVSGKPPSKDTPKPWWSEGAWREYLTGTPDPASQRLGDAEFADAESTYGIEISPESGSVVEGQFYSAHYLRLREGWQLGVFAQADDKTGGDAGHKRDLITELLPNSGIRTPVIIGGQQRVCTALREATGTPPLPHGLTEGFAKHDGKWLVKWILLSPAVFPGIAAGISKRGTERKAHPGGWLPTWVCPQSGKVLLESVSPEERKRRRNLNAAGKGYASTPNIDARLVAAIIGKPLPVTGWALPNEADPDRAQGGAKSTHLAVPAGSIYYFEAESPEAAKALATALNWHGSGVSQPSTFNPQPIRNRRSTLFGEKGFGLGVCGTWDFHPATLKTDH